MLLLNLRATGGPLYRRVYHALKTAIRAGRLGPAARLPSTRALAQDLGVSRNTVMLAYEQLAAEGYVVSRHRSITSVAAAVPAPVLPAPAGPQAETRLRISSYARRLTTHPAMRSSVAAAGRAALRYDFR